MDFHLLLVRAVNPMNKFIDDVVGWKWGSTGWPVADKAFVSVNPKMKNYGIFNNLWF
jgi:hypothetical protein